MEQQWLPRIRATRAAPPGLAATDNQRRSLYNAALQQFEELLNAAATVGPASQPILLFYALEQAGQAVLAAYVKRDVKGSHGLAIKPASYELRLHEMPVEPNGNGVFQAIADALSAAKPTSPMRLGELWASLPEGATAQFNGAEYQRALAVYPQDKPGPAVVLRLTDCAPAWIFSFPSGLIKSPPDKQAEWLTDYLAPYPSAANWESPIPDGVPVMADPAAGYGARLQWRLPASSGSAGERFDYLLTTVAPRYDQYGHGWLRPAVGGPAVQHPLLTWWLILYALSMLARYRPACWTAMLDVASSPDAVPLETAMRDALTAVPRLMLEALTGGCHLNFERF